MWLLERHTLKIIEQAQAAGVVPTVEQQIEFEARTLGDSSGSGIMSIAGNSAQISITGVLTKVPNFFAFLFGGGNTTYSDIVQAMTEANNNSDIKDITLAIDSPGGQFAGLFDALDAIQASKKPVEAVVNGMAASAAFAIATQADKITASSRADQLGSVGVVGGIRINESIVELTSTAAPKKRPDVTTAKGKADVIAELDALHEIFADAIATGRGTTVARVNKEFGQGATLLAGEALKRGMIDAIKEPEFKAVATPLKSTAHSSGQPQENGKMDLATFKTEHPAVFDAAKAVGAEEERDRVNAHLVMGEQSGDMKTAIAAIADGSAMTATLSAKYMAAGMARSDVAARQEDDAASTAGDGATASDTVDEDDAVAAIVAANFGGGDDV